MATVATSPIDPDLRLSCCHEKLPPRGTLGPQGCKNHATIRAVQDRPYAVTNYCRDCWESQFHELWLKIAVEYTRKAH